MNFKVILKEIRLAVRAMFMDIVDKSLWFAIQIQILSLFIVYVLIICEYVLPH